MSDFVVRSDPEGYLTLDEPVPNQAPVSGDAIRVLISNINRGLHIEAVAIAVVRSIVDDDGDFESYSDALDELVRVVRSYQ